MDAHPRFTMRPEDFVAGASVAVRPEHAQLENHCRARAARGSPGGPAGRPGVLLRPQDRGVTGLGLSSARLIDWHKEVLVRV